MEDLNTMKGLVYNVDLFAEKMKKRRKELRLSQNQVSKLTGISTNALRLMENGKVIPKLETLSILSSLYKLNLIKEFGDTMISDAKNFQKLQRRIEALFYHDNIDLLVKEYDYLKSFLSEENSTYHNIMIQQLQALVGAFIAKNRDDHLKKALTLLQEGIHLTTPAFSFDNFDMFKYSMVELRILMNIAIAKRDLGEKELYLKILEFLFHEVPETENLYLKVCHNLATAYRHFDRDEKAVDIAAEGIRISQKHNDYHALHILYFGKGVSEFRLNREDWKKSITLSLYMAEGFGKEQLQKRIYTNCRDFFHMPVDELGITVE